jgi:transporter family protein
VFLAIIAGVLGSVGIISFYILLTKKDASSAVPLTALYPILTAILAIIFLKEKLTIVKSAGIVLAGIALYLLSL